MAVYAGAKAIATGDFVCAQCGEEVFVRQGEAIPRCPNCDSIEFKERRNEPGDPPTHASPYEPETRSTVKKHL